MTTTAGQQERVIPAQTSWKPEPAMTGSLGLVEIPDVRLWCWDTGGRGQTIVFLHPWTGHGGVWGYQQEFFARAGYRVITYSRRGHYRSEAGPEDDPGTVIGDLHALMDTLGVRRFHLIGTAAGGFAVFDYALTYPDRLLSCTVASTLAGIADPEWRETTGEILPPTWSELPHDFAEVGPSYRAANPDGVAAWNVHAEHAVVTPVSQGRVNTLTWPVVEQVAVPTLLITGECDLYLPPMRLRQIAEHVPGAESVILAEAGHAAFWEQYIGFNSSILRHVTRHRRRR